ncbi:MAG: hypothetical protein CMP20_09235 [Rickettsiales bacterium]|nr:hypothetical protein [Rickettsiales bacterium]
MATRLVSRGGAVWLATKDTFYNLSCAVSITKQLTLFRGTPSYEVFYGHHDYKTYMKGTAEYKLVDTFIQGNKSEFGGNC